MKKDLRLLVLGMMPWNYSELSDTIRSTILASDFSNIVYINPQAEKRSLAMNWSARQDGEVSIWNPPYSLIPTRHGLHRLREKLSASTLESFVSKRLGAGWREDTIMYVTPTTLEQSYEYVMALKPKHLVFDILDDNLSFPSIQPEKRKKLQEMYREIGKRATVITAVSQHLVNMAQELLGKEAAYLPNAVDIERFSKNSGHAPVDLDKIVHPRITFVGALTSWIDFPLLSSAARELKDMQFVMIGPIDYQAIDNRQLEVLQSLENVHFLGAKPYGEVPAYLHASDVLLLPRTTDPHSLACDPLKVYEYLATGKPVVSTNHPSIERFSSFVKSGATAEEFTDGIRAALDRSKEEEARQQAAIAGLSWEARARRLGELIGEKLN
ncbi:glycosyltransferase [Mesobacillus zeae]|uniref:Glycosyltransferase n=1 Tax=Mesobacillus zeae TaxID=1917180 RepID=A0A398AX42_9BACI|nr:glycosyltransferase [Mesobacillus zeae]RID82141.1 glycosyltransferase [Mesobacillus zeae]